MRRGRGMRLAWESDRSVVRDGRNGWESVKTERGWEGIDELRLGEWQGGSRDETLRLYG